MSCWGSSYSLITPSALLHMEHVADVVLHQNPKSAQWHLLIETDSWLQYCMLVVILSAKQHHWKSDVASICMHHNQLQVYRVQNKKLWRAFSPSQPSMKERWAHEPGLSVLISGLETLWHGTSQ